MRSPCSSASRPRISPRRNSTLAEFAAPQSMPLSLPSELARRRPDIRAEEARLHAATAAVGVATANLYPQIKLTGSLSQQALTTDRICSKGSSDAFGLVGNLTAPLFNGGRLRAERRASIAAMEGSARELSADGALRLSGRSPTCSPRSSTMPSRSRAQQKALDAAETNLSHDP